MKGETRTAEFLRRRQRQRPHSGAAGSATASSRRATPSASISPTAPSSIPDDHFDRADMLRWMFWEQYNHEPNIATLRFWLRFVGLDALTEAQRVQIGRQAQGRATLRWS